MAVTVRFAPSPTGFLHIGGARTALFNWLFARHHGGQFLLRIEDTDRERSTPQAIDAIIDGLEWLGLDWDREPVFQSRNAARHAEAARQLMTANRAYYCYCTPAELAEMRAKAEAEGRPERYDGRWRDRDAFEAPPDVAPVIRFKAPRDGETVIDDAVQGRVRVANDQLDDMVLLRADGTPTYMASVVVDDHDMGITHVIRGHDHLTNAFRQTQLYRALGWEVPVFAHVPLIHGRDGTRLSKRHGALGLEAYREMGYLPEALRNYLLRLGWSHGDHEIIGTDEAIAWFDLDGIGRSPARFDLDRLANLNAHYLRQTEHQRLVAMIVPRIEATLGHEVPAVGRERLAQAMTSLTKRSKTLQQLSEISMFYVMERPITLSPKAAKLLDTEGRAELRLLHRELAALKAWDQQALEACVRGMAESRGGKLGSIAQPLRAALTGTTESPGIFEVMAILGRDQVLGRIEDVLA
ncbi:MAG: glutamate--tRNA ligase [Kiloniellales bacterium]